MAQANKVKNAVDKQSINNYSQSFKLLRRFRNFLRKDVVSFQQIRLLYMAFSKAAIEKKLDPESQYFNLYKQANDAVVKMYQKADENKEKYKDSGFQIVDTESNIFQKIDKLIKSKQIDIGVRLTKRFVNMINTKPDKAKAKRLLTSINNAIKNERIMKDNRLFDQVKHAKKELEDYLDENDALEVVNYVDGKKDAEKDEKNNNKKAAKKTDNNTKDQMNPKLKELKNSVMQIGRKHKMMKSGMNGAKETFRRSKSKYKSARAAWSDISKETGKKAKEVKPDHTKKSYRWKVK